jgi:hypothetical protein
MDLKYLSPLNPGGRNRNVGDAILAGGNVTRSSSATAETTLDQLVLPPGHKNIVKSLISQHFQDKATGRYEAEEKDVVRGKGTVFPSFILKHPLLHAADSFQNRQGLDHIAPWRSWSR